MKVVGKMEEEAGREIVPLGVGEDLMQYVWSAVQFDYARLKTTDGKNIQLIQPGILNRNAGPDFSGSRILMDYLDLTGDVEIHVKSREWYTHRHHLDPKYNSVILHVVWEQGDKPILRHDGTEVPELVLKGRVPEVVIEKYQGLQATMEEIPCASLWKQITPVDWEPHVNDTGRLRLLEKARQLLPRLKTLKQDRRQLLWEEIAGGMGGMVNREAFRAVAREVPIRMVEAVSGDVLKLEALLLGAAGLLSGEPADDYFHHLHSEWAHLSHKNSIGQAAVGCSSLRMRPGSLPYLRLAQLAALVHSVHFLEEYFLGDVYTFFLKQEICASPYWDTHHVPGVVSPHQKKRVGNDQKLHIILNSLIPIELIMHGGLDRVRVARVVLGKLESLPPENNRVIRYYAQFGVHPRNALQGQGLIGLHKTQCQRKKCLDCAIGQQVLGPDIL